MEEKEDIDREDDMTPAGWIFLLISWGLIILLVSFCFLKVFSKKELK